MNFIFNFISNFVLILSTCYYLQLMKLPYINSAYDGWIIIIRKIINFNVSTLEFICWKFGFFLWISPFETIFFPFKMQIFRKNVQIFINFIFILDSKEHLMSFSVLKMQYLTSINICVGSELQFIAFTVHTPTKSMFGEPVFQFPTKLSWKSVSYVATISKIAKITSSCR